MKLKEIKRAIERAKPKKPYHKKRDTDEYWYCPNCHNIVSAICRDSKGKLSYKTTNCCSTCGQKLDWKVRDICGSY